MTFLQPQDGFVLANGVRLHYRHWKTPDARADLPSFLLLHGLASSSYTWNLVAPLLAAAGYEVVALDQRGHGESEKPEHGYDFATILADDQAVARALTLRHPILVGHSWGAMVALEYASAPGADLSALVVVDGAVDQLALRPGWSLEQALIDLAPPRYAGISRATFLGFFDASPLAQAWTPELEASVLHIVEQHADDTVAPRLTYENHLQIIAAMWQQPTLELYARIHCPLEVIVAERSASDLASQQRLERREGGLAQIHGLQPGARIIRMSNTIHDIQLQRPEKLAEEILAFLSAQGNKI